MSLAKGRSTQQKKSDSSSSIVLVDVILTLLDEHIECHILKGPSLQRYLFQEK